MRSKRVINKDRVGRIIVGNQKHHGIFTNAILYMILISIGFVFVYPLFIVLSTSLKNIYDIVNPMVKWVPEEFYWQNYVRAYKVMGGLKVLRSSILNIGLVAICQTFTAALVGYGLAKYNFWGKKLVYSLIIATFIIPGEVLFLPQYVLYSQYKMVNSILPILLPSMFGQGLKNAIFILIFYQFFRLSPKSLDEAAFIDGAGHIRTFFSINLVMAVPAIMVNFIFSFVWNWNDTATAGKYFGDKVITVLVALQRFKQTYEGQFPFKTTNDPLLRINEGVEMAGTILAILPLIILYIIVEKKLVESIDRTGITGE